MNTRRIFIFVVVFSFISRLLYLLYFPLQYTDYYLINTAAQNLVDGHGMGFMRSMQTDLSSFYFEGLRLWPPLVTATVGFFMKITGGVHVANSLAIGVVLVSLFFFLDCWLTDLQLTTSIKTIVFLFIGINPELIKQPALSDLAAAAFFIGACSASYRLLLNKEKITNWQVLLTGMLFFLPTAFRYQYYPVSYFFPFMLTVLSYYFKDPVLRRNAGKLLTVVIALTLTQELFLFFYTKQPITQSVAMDENGFFLYNLRYIYPFFLKSFINISYIENINQQLIRHYAVLYSYGIVTVFSVWCIKIIAKLRTTNDELQKRKNSGILLLLIGLILPVIILCLLSLIHNSRTGEPGGWTYVLEGRYYIGSSLLTMVLFAWYIEQQYKQSNLAVKTTGKALLVMVLIYNSLLHVKFFYNISKDNIPDKEVNNRNDRKEIKQLIDTLTNDKTKLVICSNEPYFAYYLYNKEVAVTQKITALVKHEISTKEQVNLLIITATQKTPDELALIQRTGAVLIKKLNACQLYLAKLQPTQTVQL